mmetsp:Transcript_25222/g.47415  ORF Transcript_25222/g.47415 Transcript_25222/m.47415 type:complete len:174 (-) Transcript_25222:25-546(-)
MRAISLSLLLCLSCVSFVSSFQTTFLKSKSHPATRRDPASEVPTFNGQHGGVTTLLGLLGWSDEENKILDEMVRQKSISREQAEAEYKKYKMNPNDYALMKGEEYYTSLGYSSLMEGVLAEAEKDGRGDEVRDRIEKFKKDSQIKAYGVIGVFILTFAACKVAYENDPSLFGK